MMTLRLKGGKELELTNEEGVAVERMLEEGLEFIQIGNELYNKFEILSVTEKRLTEADLLGIFGEVKLLEAKDRCRGQYSIQWRINQLAQKSGKDWSKRIQSKKWRKAVYDKLKTTNEKWCDYTTDQCSCEKDYLSAKKRYEAIFK